MDLINPKIISTQELLNYSTLISKRQIIIDLINSKIIPIDDDFEGPEALLNSLPPIPTTFKLKSFRDFENKSNEEIEKITATPHYIHYLLRNEKILRIYECGICLKTFQQQYSLIRHLSAHTKERNYICNECGKGFRQQSTLTQHRAIHSAERPHTCEVCNKSFNRTSTLISHRKTHSNIKPFECPVCGRGFHQKGNLKNHVFTHTNERPYRCTFCNRGFNQKSNLTCHMKKVHSAKCGYTWKCERCDIEFDKRAELRTHEIEIHHFQVPLTKRTRKNKKSKTPPDSSSSVQEFNNNDQIALINYGLPIPAIDTHAMRKAKANNEIPFAVIHFIQGEPALVRVIDCGDYKHLLRPVQKSDYEAVKERRKNMQTTSSSIQSGLKFPIVATIYQTLDESGESKFEITSPKNIYKFSNAEQILNINTNIENLSDTHSIHPTNDCLPQTEDLPLYNDEMNKEMSLLSLVSDDNNTATQDAAYNYINERPKQTRQQPKAIVLQNDLNLNSLIQTTSDYNENYDDYTFQNIATNGYLTPTKNYDENHGNNSLDGINVSLFENFSLEDIEACSDEAKATPFDEEKSIAEQLIWNFLKNRYSLDIVNAINSILRSS